MYYIDYYAGEILVSTIDGFESYPSYTEIKGNAPKHCTHAEVSRYKKYKLYQSTEKPYSQEDYEEAKQQGLDLDNWDDYVRFYRLGMGDET